MNEIIQKTPIRLVTGVLIALLVMSPLQTNANTHHGEAYAAMNTNERIAYLYGMIAQLQVVLEIMLRNEGTTTDTSNPVRSNIEVDTLSATDVNRGGARLRGRVDLNRENGAMVWFEYGERSSRLDERTTKRRISDSMFDVSMFSTMVDDLNRNTRYYYRAVAENEDGGRVYGATRSFTTGVTRSDDRDSGDTATVNGDFALSINSTSISTGNSVRVNWEVPNNAIGSRNWIGLYRVGQPNSSYMKWSYIDSTSRGTQSFTIDSPGEYELRLFLRNSYDLEVKSRTIRVN